ncbi:MAG: ATP-binding protein [Lachnospiraceae bacterium]|nr:ATP-binding protein [Lachnospiraceae bacterium]
MKTDKLLLYGNLSEDVIIENITGLYEMSRNELEADVKDEEIAALASQTVGELIKVGVEHGFEGNLLHAYIAYSLVNDENAFSTSMERKRELSGTLNEIALHDFEIIKTLFDIDLKELDRVSSVTAFSLIEDFKPDNGEGKTFNKRIRDRICELAVKLSGAREPREFLQIMTEFYGDFGVGKFGLHKAFRISVDSDDKVSVDPITRVKHIYLEDLVGYESQKKKLTDNTEAFLAGRPANNVLLFGDAGTGKSSCIKGILNRYYDDGLRIIEIFKHQFRYLNAVISQIKDRNYKFIIYMDDLSFEDQEIEYKYLKAVIEGGLEKQPGNILIYATSNRRHLIHEGFADKLDRGENDDIHESDTVQEKLSLSARFGVTIYFGRPDKKEFNNIVKVLGERVKTGIDEDELIYLANQWELSHGGLSGRTAAQFIDHIMGTYNLKGGNGGK